MTNVEAIETIKIAIAEVEWNYPMDYTIAFETAIEALEKQIPKKPVRRTIYTEYLQGYYTIRVCPVCGVDTPVPRGLESWEFWCPDCGQALDWSET